MSGVAQAQTNEQLKQMLDQALKTIDAQSGRVQALETERDRAKPAPPEAGAAVAAQWGAPVVSPAARSEYTKTPGAYKARAEVYGQVMLDTIYHFKRMNPDWQATLRPSPIPVACPGDPGCGADGAWPPSLRQSSLGLRSFIPTSWGLAKTDLSFDLFGTDGSASIHWLSIWVELGQISAGQSYSNFMDVDMFPNTLDYWGSSGMVFVRNPQLRITLTGLEFVWGELEQYGGASATDYRLQFSTKVMS